jgi:hypothetical protein
VPTNEDEPWLQDERARLRDGDGPDLRRTRSATVARALDEVRAADSIAPPGMIGPTSRAVDPEPSMRRPKRRALRF